MAVGYATTFPGVSVGVKAFLIELNFLIPAME